MSRWLSLLLLLPLVTSTMVTSTNLSLSELESYINSSSSWSFQVNWTYEQPIQGIIVKPEIECPYLARSTFVSYSNNNMTITTSEIISGDQLANSSRYISCDRPLEHAVHKSSTHISSTCQIIVLWKVDCVLPCDLFCPSDTAIYFNTSHYLACAPNSVVCTALRSNDQWTMPSHKERLRHLDLLFFASFVFVIGLVIIRNVHEKPVTIHQPRLLA